jgi:hypothetical protein
MHHDIICSQGVTIICSPAGCNPRIPLTPKLSTIKNGGSGMMVDPSAHPPHMNVLKPCFIYVDWMWETFHVGLGLQRNQCTMTSHVPQLQPKNSTNFLNLGPTGMVEVG